MNGNYFTISFTVPPSLTASVIRELLRQDSIMYRAVDVSGGTANVDVFEIAAAARIARALRSRGHRVEVEVRGSSHI